MQIVRVNIHAYTDMCVCVCSDRGRASYASINPKMSLFGRSVDFNRYRRPFSLLTVNFQSWSVQSARSAPFNRIALRVRYVPPVENYRHKSHIRGIYKKSVLSECAKEKFEMSTTAEIFIFWDFFFVWKKPARGEWKRHRKKIDKLNLKKYVQNVHITDYITTAYTCMSVCVYV